jgi:hypothetical protein
MRRGESVLMRFLHAASQTLEICSRRWTLQTELLCHAWLREKMCDQAPAFNGAQVVPTEC